MKTKYLTEDQIDQIVNKMVEFRQPRIKRAKELQRDNNFSRRMIAKTGLGRLSPVPEACSYALLCDGEFHRCKTVRTLRKELACTLIDFDELDLNDDNFLFFNMLGEVVLCLDPHDRNR